MKILFAVSNENIAEAVKREYQNNFKAQLITKNVYYFNAIIKELQNNKTYDVVIISEDLEPFANNNYDIIDKFLCDKLQIIREEAINEKGERVPIIFITTDRHILGDSFTTKLYEIGINNALVGNDRSIENVCQLMFHPRNKQEAKAYYRVNSEIDNTPKEDDVKEEEIKNIIAHYKKLGKAEEKYVESFDNIASQYSDAQLKVIIRFLPLNVKAVLEAQSPKYQSLTTFANNYESGAVKNVPQTEKKETIKEKNVHVDTTNNRVLEQISSLQNNSNVIIPNAMNINKVRKVATDNETNKKQPAEERKFEGLNSIENIKTDEPVVMHDRRKNDVAATLPGFEDFEDSSSKVSEENTSVLPGVETLEDENVNTPEIEPVVKRGRGRPRKNPIQTSVPEAPKRGRGRPRKVQLEEETKVTTLPGLEKEENVSATLPGLEEDRVSASTTLPGLEEENTSASTMLPGLEEENISSSATLPGFEEEESATTTLPGIEEENVVPETLPGFEDREPSIPESTYNPQEMIHKTNSMSEKQSIRYENIEYMIPADKRIASFIGTSKAGVSFIVNNLAHMLSSYNINVAILDMTRNKNSFYIYTNNEESLRNKAERSIYSLLEGNAYGVKINKNLTVYTALPTDTEEFYEADKVLKTLIDNYSVVLIDCDYDTPIGYFDNSTDLFLVQNMDILTMQPLTTFLKELKSKGVLKDEKMRFISNMETKVKGVNSQILLSAIAVYKDPGMAYTVDLFDKNLTKVFTVPFDIEAYNKYLTSLVECNISLNGYSKAILSSLKAIAACIYPLLNNGKNNKKNGGSYTPPSLGNYSNTTFNNNIGNTLNQMKNQY